MTTPQSPVLVTGGTGTLGRPTVDRLRAAGHDVRVLSRHAGEGRILGDLATGAGLAGATDGARTVLHLANGAGHEAEQTRRIATAAKAAGVEHFLYISIVGIERNQALGYYRQKLESEQAVQASGVPWTILRATQFHDFVTMFAARQLRWPVALLPAMRMQPIAVDEVAERLVELVAAGPSGRVADIAGPEQGTMAGFARQWYASRGEPAHRIVELRLPGRAFANMRSGTQLGTLPGYGTRTFADWAATTADAG